jgi:Na+/citrate or Na+/malate symporter
MTIKRGKHEVKKPKKRETMKLIVGFVTLNAVGWIWSSYILAAFGREQIAQDLSITALTSLVAVVLTYALKSLGEKHSLNKHGLRVPDDGSGKHYLKKPDSGQTNGGI